MAPTPAVYIAYTGQINPPGAEPVLTRDQVWEGLELKVDHAQDFVPAIVSTDVISRSEDAYGRKVTHREIIFKEGNRRVKEEVTMYHPTKVVFQLTNGSRVQNIVSTGANGEMYMTYDFEWLHEGTSDEELGKLKEKYAGMSKMAVESSIDAIRDMVKNGRIKS